MPKGGGGECSAAGEGRGERADLGRGGDVVDVEVGLGGVGPVGDVVREAVVDGEAVDVGFAGGVGGKKSGSCREVDLVEAGGLASVRP